MVTIQYRSKHMLLRPYEYDSIVQNPISEADFKWILHRNCEGTEQLHKFISTLSAFQCSFLQNHGTVTCILTMIHNLPHICQSTVRSLN